TLIQSPLVEKRIFRVHALSNSSATIELLCFLAQTEGDSDGPLVCKGIAVRVVSFNEKGNCDKPKKPNVKPNVYTKISKYLSWIKCIIKY
uniref:Peptidase S1 domain-containing protein n=1 Tax=Hucho hucho TaxID=62062 RepID=A0A4W5M3T7_9TELE